MHSVLNTSLDMHSDLNGFATLLKAKRQEMGLSMAAFGDLIGRSAGAIHAYENGELPPASMLTLLAGVLKVDRELLRELIATERTAPGDLAAVPTPSAPSVTVAPTEA